MKLACPNIYALCLKKKPPILAKGGLVRFLYIVKGDNLFLCVYPVWLNRPTHHESPP